MRILENPKVFLFDWDDTLVQTWEAKFAHHTEVAKTFYGIDLTEETLLNNWGKPFEEMICKLYQTTDLATAKQMCQRLAHKYPKVLMPETVGVLESLRRQNKKVGLITATTKQNHLYDLNHLEVPSSLFDYIQTSSDTEIHKPDPLVFDPALAWIDSLNEGIGMDKIVYVGDLFTDMEAAQRAGIPFVGVCTGIISAEQFAKRGATAIPSIAHLLLA